MTDLFSPRPPFSHHALPAMAGRYPCPFFLPATALHSPNLVQSEESGRLPGKAGGGATSRPPPPAAASPSHTSIPGPSPRRSRGHPRPCPKRSEALRASDGLTWALVPGLFRLSTAVPSAMTIVTASGARTRMRRRPQQLPNRRGGEKRRKTRGKTRDDNEADFPRGAGKE